MTDETKPEERIAYTNGTSSIIHYFWGKDISGTLQGAGGVGGLLYLMVDDEIYIPSYDNNGNITRYLDGNGNTVAEYTYNAFGDTIFSSGSLADMFRHRFSTKYYDAVTELYYYGYRFYNPTLMRWLNRDPLLDGDYLLDNLFHDDSLAIVNAYNFILSSVTCNFDILGQKSSKVQKGKWLIVGRAFEYHNWNCFEWEPGYGTTAKYLRHLRKETFRKHIQVPSDRIDDFAKSFIVALGMYGDTTSYWCVSFSPLVVQKKVEDFGVSYRLKIYVSNFDKHPKCGNSDNRMEIHQTQFEKRWITYEL